MCRIDERIYVRADGHRSKFQDTSLCDRAKRKGKMCSEVDVRRTEYSDPTSSPVASSPLTPTHNPRARRGSTSSRPSTRDGSIKSLKPEIHIDLGSKNGKPIVSITTGKSKRESTGSTYTYDSPGSEASHTLRTGLPDMSPPSLYSSHGGLRPKPGHHRNPSSDESFSGSSHVAPVYHASSDYDTPSLATGTTASSSGDRPIIHNGRRSVPSPINTTLGQAGGPYRTAEVTPRDVHNKSTERNRHTGSSHAPKTSGRDEDRRRREEQKRQQEDLDREVAANLLREENQKQVRFENDRAKLRAEERAQDTHALYEQRRAEERERIRQQEKKVREAQEARDAAAKRSKSTSTTKSSQSGSARMAAAQAAEQQRLVAADELHMQEERRRVEALERGEQLQQRPMFQERQPSSLRERQEDPRHYDPRAAAAVPGVARRGSVSGQAPKPGRWNSKRSTAAPQPHDDRQQPRQPRQPPPVSYYNHPSARSDLPQARQPHPSSSHPTSAFTPPAPTPDPWAFRTMDHALPSARGPGVGHNFPQPQHPRFHPSQHATHRLNQALHTADDADADSDSGDDLYAPRR